MINAERAKEIAMAAKGELNKVLQDIESQIETAANEGKEFVEILVPAYFATTIATILKDELYRVEPIHPTKGKFQVSWSGLPF